MAKSILTQTGIYIITCLPTGKIYIGSANDIPQRFRAHLSELRNDRHSNSYLQRAWNKHGEAAFTFETLELCDPDRLVAREQYWLDTLQSYQRHIGFNIRPTANNAKHAAESLIKMSVWQVGKKMSAEARLKMSIAGKGKKKTLEHRAKIAQGNIGHRHTPESKAKMSYSSGWDWIVTTPTGQEIKVHNMRQFCRENGLDQAAMGKVAMGKRPHHKGWRCRRIDG